MHGGNSRLSRRWLGAGWQLIRSDCRGSQFEHLSVAAVVAAGLGLFQQRLAQRSLGLLGESSVCVSVRSCHGRMFSIKKIWQVFPNVWELPYLWTHKGTFWKWPHESSFIGRCLSLQTSTTCSGQSQSRLSVERVSSFIKCQNKSLFCFFGIYQTLFHSKMLNYSKHMSPSTWHTDQLETGMCLGLFVQIHFSGLGND